MPTLTMAGASPLEYGEKEATARDETKEAAPDEAREGKRAEAKLGGLAQLARAPALQAGGHRFDSDILHRM